MDFILDAVAEKVIIYPSSLDYVITSGLVEKINYILNRLFLCGHISKRTKILSDKTLENPIFSHSQHRHLL